MSSSRVVGWCAVIVVAVGLFACPSDCTADITYRWVFEQSIYQVNPGETVDLVLYLEERTQTGDVAITDPDAGVGLGSIGVKVLWDDFATEPAKVLNDADVIPNPAFDWPDITKAYTDRAELNELIYFGTPPVYGTKDPTDPLTFLTLAGTFRFTAGNIAGEQTAVRVTDLDPLFDDTLDSTGGMLDDLIADGRAIIQTVPEPSSFLLGLALIGGLFVVRMRRRG